jgi:hypothetical protein
VELLPHRAGQDNLAFFGEDGGHGGEIQSGIILWEGFSGSVPAILGAAGWPFMSQCFGWVQELNGDAAAGIRDSGSA